MKLRPRRTRRMPGMQSLVNSRLIENTPQSVLAAVQRQLPTGAGARQAHRVSKSRMFVVESGEWLGRSATQYIPALSAHGADAIDDAILSLLHLCTTVVNCLWPASGRHTSKRKQGS